MKYKGAMSIAGSDSIAGAGMQADLKTFYELEVFAGSVITAVTSQNTVGVRSMQIIQTKIVHDQIKAVDEEIEVRIVKCGMLYNKAIIKEVETYIKAKNLKLILDPVMVATSKARLMDDKSLEAMKNLCSLSFLLTPNIAEAEALTGVKISTEADIDRCAKQLLSRGTQNVLIKGGHFKESDNQVINRLYEANGSKHKFINTRKAGELHGSGCTLASATAAYYFKENNIVDAIAKAVAFMEYKIANCLFEGLESFIIA